MKTDLQKFQEFFDEMNIKWHIYNNGYEQYMWIDDKHLCPHYGADLRIYFDDDDKFWKFETWGD
jgi:hypothetical protein